MTTSETRVQKTIRGRLREEDTASQDIIHWFNRLIFMTGFLIHKKNGSADMELGQSTILQTTPQTAREPLIDCGKVPLTSQRLFVTVPKEKSTRTGPSMALTLFGGIVPTLHPLSTGRIT